MSTPLICRGCKAVLEPEEVRFAKRKAIAEAQKAAVQAKAAVEVATNARSAADAAVIAKAAALELAETKLSTSTAAHVKAVAERDLAEQSVADFEAKLHAVEVTANATDGAITDARSQLTQQKNAARQDLHTKKAAADIAALDLKAAQQSRDHATAQRSGADKTANEAAAKLKAAVDAAAMANATTETLRADALSAGDEQSARKIVCTNCQTVTTIPFEEAVDDELELDWLDNSVAGSDVDPVFQRDKFLLHQKHLSINTRYVVFDEAGNEIMHVVRPTHLFQSLLAAFAIIVEIILLVGLSVLIGLSMSQAIGDVATGAIIVLGVILAGAAALYTFFLLAPKRHITFYKDAEHQQKILQVMQDQKVTLRMMRYTVLDAAGQELGRFRKDYLANILRKKWDGFDAQGNHLYVIREDEFIMALLRRVVGSIFAMLPTNFVIHQVGKKGQDGPLLGEFNRKFTLLDRYVLDCTHDRDRVMDRRLAIAIGVLLDTGESR